MFVEYETSSKSKTISKLKPASISQNTLDEKRSKKRKRTTQEDEESLTPKRKVRSKHDATHIDASITSSKDLKTPPSSSFYQQTSSFYLPLPPITQNHPLQGLCAEHLSPLILTYYPPLKGVLLSYDNARLSTTPQEGLVADNAPALAQIIDEYAAPHVWLTANFLLFRPQRGNTLEGWINLQNEGNIGLVCFNFFNATVEKKRLPKGWKWKAGGLDVKSSKKKLKGSERADETGLGQVEAIAEVHGLSDIEGHFEVGDGRRIKGPIQFTVKDLETSRSSGGDNSMVSIEGTLLDDTEERDMREMEIREEDSRARRHRRKKPNAVYTMSGALMNDEGQDKEQEPPQRSRSESIY